MDIKAKIYSVPEEKFLDLIDNSNEPCRAVLGYLYGPEANDISEFEGRHGLTAWDDAWDLILDRYNDLTTVVD